MVTVTLSKDRKRLNLKAHYIYKERLKSIYGASFDFEIKCWTIPISSIDMLEMEFKGELYYKTPRWEILGQPKPEKVPKTLYSKNGIEVPKLTYSLYDYQSEGAEFMIDRILHRGYVLNADSVGLGKTIQSIATVKYFIQHGYARKIIIICKKSIKGQWGREIKKFIGAKEGMLPIFITGDTKKLRNEAYEGIKEAKYGILITNYHNFLNDFDAINESKYDLAIVDEVHTLKSHEGKMNGRVGDTIRGINTIFLTGTPIMSKPSDIFGIIQMADRECFGNYKDFADEYLVLDSGIYGVQVAGAKNLDKLNGEIQDFMIRRTADDVSIDLPEVTLEEIVVEADKTQETIDFKLQEKVEMFQTKKQNMLDMGVLPDSDEFKEVLDKEKMYLSAKQFIADDPRCFEILRESQFAKEVISMMPKKYAMSPKTEATIDLVEDIIESENKVIIFTHFKTAGDILEADIKKKLKVNVLRYTGAENEATREKNIQLFTESEDYNILIGTEACAEGLNLQCANYLINYEQPDTYAQKEQRIGRIRRAGSKHSHAHVYDIVTELSQDRIKLNKLERDKDLSTSLISEN